MRLTKLQYHKFLRLLKAFNISKAYLVLHSKIMKKFYKYSEQLHFIIKQKLIKRKYKFRISNTVKYNLFKCNKFKKTTNWKITKKGLQKIQKKKSWIQLYAKTMKKSTKNLKENCNKELNQRYEIVYENNDHHDVPKDIFENKSLEIDDIEIEKQNVNDHIENNKKIRLEIENVNNMEVFQIIESDEEEEILINDDIDGEIEKYNKNVKAKKEEMANEEVKNNEKNIEKDKNLENELENELVQIIEIYDDEEILTNNDINCEIGKCDKNEKAKKEVEVTENNKKNIEKGKSLENELENEFVQIIEIYDDEEILTNNDIDGEIGKYKNEEAQKVIGNKIKNIKEDINKKNTLETANREVFQIIESDEEDEILTNDDIDGEIEKYYKNEEAQKVIGNEVENIKEKHNKENTLEMVNREVFQMIERGEEKGVPRNDDIGGEIEKYHKNEEVIGNEVENIKEKHNKESKLETVNRDVLQIIESDEEKGVPRNNDIDGEIEKCNENQVKLTENNAKEKILETESKNCSDVLQIIDTDEEDDGNDSVIENHKKEVEKENGDDKTENDEIEKQNENVENENTNYEEKNRNNDNESDGDTDEDENRLMIDFKEQEEEDDDDDDYDEEEKDSELINESTKNVQERLREQLNILKSGKRSVTLLGDLMDNPKRRISVCAVKDPINNETNDISKKSSSIENVSSINNEKTNENNQNQKSGNGNSKSDCGISVTTDEQYNSNEKDSVNHKENENVTKLITTTETIENKSSENEQLSSVLDPSSIEVELIILENSDENQFENEDQDEIPNDLNEKENSITEEISKMINDDDDENVTYMDFSDENLDTQIQESNENNEETRRVSMSSVDVDTRPTHIDTFVEKVIRRKTLDHNNEESQTLNKTSIIDVLFSKISKDGNLKPVNTVKGSSKIINDTTIQKQFSPIPSSTSKVDITTDADANATAATFEISDNNDELALIIDESNQSSPAEFAGFTENEINPSDISGMLPTPSTNDENNSQITDSSSIFVSKKLDEFLRINNLENSSNISTTTIKTKSKNYYNNNNRQNDGLVFDKTRPPIVPKRDEFLLKFYQKPRTLADKRQQLEKQQNSLIFSMLESQNTIYYEIKKREKTGLCNINILKSIQESSDIPLNRDCWIGITWAITPENKFYNQIIKIDNKEYRLIGSKGNHINRYYNLIDIKSKLFKKNNKIIDFDLCEKICKKFNNKNNNIKINLLNDNNDDDDDEDIESNELIDKSNSLNGKLFLLSPNKKRRHQNHDTIRITAGSPNKKLKNHSNIENSSNNINNMNINIDDNDDDNQINIINNYRPGPLNTKCLNRSLEPNLGPTEIYDMPQIQLELFPKIGRPLDNFVKPYLKLILPQNNITREWAEFSVSTLQQTNLSSSASSITSTTNKQHIKIEKNSSNNDKISDFNEIFDEKNNKKSFTFNIPYQNHQKKVLVRRIYDRKEKINENEFNENFHNYEFCKNIDKNDKIIMDCNEIMIQMMNSVVLSLGGDSLIKDDPDINYDDTIKNEDNTIKNGNEKVSTECNIDYNLVTFKNNANINNAIKKRNKLKMELKRLNATFIDTQMLQMKSPTKSEELEASRKCTKEFCKLGCICQSLNSKIRRQHCGKENCVFKCNCYNYLNIMNKEKTYEIKSTITKKAALMLREKAVENLAKIEKDFTSTVFITNNEALVVNEPSNERKRSIKAPSRYFDYVTEHKVDRILTEREQRGEQYNDHENDDQINSKCITPLSLLYDDKIKEKEHKTDNNDKNKYKNCEELLKMKHCTVNLIHLSLNEIEPWCMIHCLYKCFCKGDSIEGKPYEINKNDANSIILINRKKENDKLLPVQTNNLIRQDHEYSKKKRNSPPKKRSRKVETNIIVTSDEDDDDDDNENEDIDLSLDNVYNKEDDNDDNDDDDDDDEEEETNDDDKDDDDEMYEPPPYYQKTKMYSRRGRPRKILTQPSPPITKSESHRKKIYVINRQNIVTKKTVPSSTTSKNQQNSNKTKKLLKQEENIKKRYCERQIINNECARSRRINTKIYTNVNRLRAKIIRNKIKLLETESLKLRLNDIINNCAQIHPNNKSSSISQSDSNNSNEETTINENYSIIDNSKQQKHNDVKLQNDSVKKSSSEIIKNENNNDKHDHHDNNDNSREKSRSKSRGRPCKRNRQKTTDSLFRSSSSLSSSSSVHSTKQHCHNDNKDNNTNIENSIVNNSTITTTNVSPISNNTKSTTKNIPPISSNITKSTISNIPPISNITKSTSKNISPISSNITKSTSKNIPPISSNITKSTTKNISPISSNITKSTTKNISPISSNITKSTTKNILPISSNITKSTTKNISPISSNITKSTISNISPISNNTKSTISNISPISNNTETTSSNFSPLPIISKVCSLNINVIQNSSTTIELVQKQQQQQQHHHDYKGRNSIIKLNNIVTNRMHSICNMQLKNTKYLRSPLPNNILAQQLKLIHKAYNENLIYVWEVELPDDDDNDDDDDSNGYNDNLNKLKNQITDNDDNDNDDNDYDGDYKNIDNSKKFYAITLKNIMPIIENVVSIRNIKSLKNDDYTTNNLPFLCNLIKLNINKLNNIHKNRIEQLSLLLFGYHTYWKICGIFNSTKSYLKNGGIFRPTPITHPSLLPKINKAYEILIHRELSQMKDDERQKALLEFYQQHQQYQQQQQQQKQQQEQLLQQQEEQLLQQQLLLQQQQQTQQKQIEMNYQKSDSGDTIDYNNTSKICIRNGESLKNLKCNLEIRKAKQSEIFDIKIPTPIKNDHRWLIINVYNDFSYIYFTNLKRSLSAERIFTALEKTHLNKTSLRFDLPNNLCIFTITTQYSNINRICFGPLPLDYGNENNTSSYPQLIFYKFHDGKLVLREDYENCLNIKPIEKSYGFYVDIKNGKMFFDIDIDSLKMNYCNNSEQKISNSTATSTTTLSSTVTTSESPLASTSTTTTTTAVSNKNDDNDDCVIIENILSPALPNTKSLENILKYHKSISEVRSSSSSSSSSSDSKSKSLEYKQNQHISRIINAIQNQYSSASTIPNSQMQLRNNISLIQQISNDKNPSKSKLSAIKHIIDQSFRNSPSTSSSYNNVQHNRKRTFNESNSILQKKIETKINSQKNLPKLNNVTATNSSRSNDSSHMIIPETIITSSNSKTNEIASAPKIVKLDPKAFSLAKSLSANNKTPSSSHASFSSSSTLGLSTASLYDNVRKTSEINQNTNKILTSNPIKVSSNLYENSNTVISKTMKLLKPIEQLSESMNTNASLSIQKDNKISKIGNCVVSKTHYPSSQNSTLPYITSAQSIKPSHVMDPINSSLIKEINNPSVSSFSSKLSLFLNQYENNKRDDVEKDLLTFSTTRSTKIKSPKLLKPHITTATITSSTPTVSLSNPTSFNSPIISRAIPAMITSTAAATITTKPTISLNSSSVINYPNIPAKISPKIGPIIRPTSTSTAAATTTTPTISLNPPPFTSPIIPAPVPPKPNPIIRVIPSARTAVTTTPKIPLKSSSLNSSIIPASVSPKSNPISSSVNSQIIPDLISPKTPPSIKKTQIISPKSPTTVSQSKSIINNNRSNLDDLSKTIAAVKLSKLPPNELERLKIEQYETGHFILYDKNTNNQLLKFPTKKYHDCYLVKSPDNKILKLDNDIQNANIHLISYLRNMSNARNIIKDCSNVEWVFVPYELNSKKLTPPKPLKESKPLEESLLSPDGFSLKRKSDQIQKNQENEIAKRIKLNEQQNVKESPKCRLILPKPSSSTVSLNDSEVILIDDDDD